MYVSIDDNAVRWVTEGRIGAQMAKVDLKSAFRMIPVHRQDWELLGMHWNDQYSYSVDTCLPLGCRSSCLFNKFTEALQWIITV